MSEPSPWREPGEESIDIYPGLVVHDDRVSGSITLGQSRLPVWAFIADAIENGWDSAEHGYECSRYGWDADTMAAFVYYLTEQRGEFARLVCLLADTERCDTSQRPWWATKKHRKRMVDQLQRCLDALSSPTPHEET